MTNYLRLGEKGANTKWNWRHTEHGTGKKSKTKCVEVEIKLSIRLHWILGPMFTFSSSVLYTTAVWYLYGTMKKQKQQV